MNQRDTVPRPLGGQGGQNRGSNLLAVGQYNERLILQLIRRAGSLPKAEIARVTELSAQTISVIINRLLKDKLLCKQPRQREKGKVGQPAVPIALNPAGAYSIGINIGRRRLESLLIDFTGSVLHRRTCRYDFPEPAQVFPAIEQDIESLAGALNPAERSRIVGVGIVAPYALGGWQQASGAPPDVLRSWDGIDIGARVSATQELPVWFANDAAAACIAELEFGEAAQFEHYLYFFVATFIGGGVVLNGTLYAGPFDNAGAVGSMPLPAIYAGETVSGDAPVVQLIQCASRYLLDDRLRAASLDPAMAVASLCGESGDNGVAAEIFDAWLSRAAPAIAFATVAAASVVDFQGIVIDGSLPRPLTKRLVSAVDEALESMDLEGLVRPQLITGAIGNDARALGGAILPFYSCFAPDRDVLLKLSVAKKQ